MGAKDLFKKYLLYLGRWQLSTPILAIVLFWLNDWNITLATIVANLIGGLIFFWVDKYIFKTNYLHPLWEIKDDVTCADCGITCQGYRLVKTKNYDRLNDPHPEFRCNSCSKEKKSRLEKAGIAV
jgi:hypothetical protein